MKKAWSVTALWINVVRIVPIKNPIKENVGEEKHEGESERVGCERASNEELLLESKSFPPDKATVHLLTVALRIFSPYFFFLLLILLFFFFFFYMLTRPSLSLLNFYTWHPPLIPATRPDVSFIARHFFKCKWVRTFFFFLLLVRSNALQFLLQLFSFIFTCVCEFIFFHPRGPTRSFHYFSNLK